MKRTEDYLSRNSIVLQSGRGWKNLNEIARKMVELHATNEKNAVPLSQVARQCGIDPAHFTRLVNNKVGFVRVYEKPLGKQVRSRGIFYLVNPVYSAAVEAGNDAYYPRTMERVVNKTGVEGLLSSVLYEEEPDDVKTGEAKPDPYLLDLLSMAGITHTDVLTVPVTLDPAIAEGSEEEAVGAIARLLHGDNHYLNVENLSTYPDSDIAEFERIMARVTWKAAMTYYAVQQIKAGRELR